MEERIFRIEDIGWYVPLKKLIIVSEEIKTTILPENIIQRISEFKSYDEELKKLPKGEFDLHQLCIKSMGILLTNQCSLRCIYCFSEAGDKKELSLTKTEIKSVIHELVKNAVINKKVNKNKYIVSELTISGGGEPTYFWNDFVFCVETFKKMCNENGVIPKVKVVTNGCMSKTRIEYMIENIDEINLSFDGTEEIQNFQRPLKNGKSSYEFVKNFINACEVAHKKILVRITVMPENFRKISEIAEWIFKTFKNVDCIHVEPMISLGRANTLKKDSSNRFLDFMYGYIAAVEKVENDYPDRIIVNSMFSYVLTEYFCSASLGTHPWVHMDGKLMPCKDYLMKEQHIVGELKEDKIVYNSKFQPLIYNLSKCKDCFAYYHCGGGCSINMPKDAEGNCLDGTSKEMCKMIQTYWLLVLKNLIKKKKFASIEAEEIKQNEDITGFKIYKLITT